LWHHDLEFWGIVTLKIILILFALTSLAARSASSKSVTKTNGEDIGLRIVGTIANSSQDKGVALVKEIENNRVKAVTIGHKLLIKYQVIEVRKKYIMLKNKDNYHLVYLAKFASEFNRSSGRQSSKQSLSSSGNSKFSEPGFERSDNKIRMTTQYRDNLLSNDLANVLMQASAIPIIENNKVKGFRFLQIDRGSIYEKAGIQDNDLITAINETSLGSVAGTIKLLHSLKKDSLITMKIQRNGVEQDISISIK
jgi:type II secretion system protein C